MCFRRPFSLTPARASGQNLVRSKLPYVSRSPHGRMPSRTATGLISGLAAGVGVGIGLGTGLLVGRHLGLRSSTVRDVRRLAGNNLSWMSRRDVAIAAALVASGNQYLIAGWPPAGVRDADKKRLLQAAAASLSSTAATSDMEEQRLELLQAPLATKNPKALTTHGDTRIDDYYWLRDDARKDKRVLEHLTRENEYTQAVMANTKQLQDTLYQEMRGRIQEEDVGVPERQHGYYYYSRTKEGQQYKIHCRRKVPAGAAPPSESDVMDESVTEEIILDENKRKEEGRHTFYMVGAIEPSPNHQLLAFSEDTVGGEKYTLHVKDLATGKEVMDPIEATSGDVEWANDNKTLFYVVKDHLDRPYKVLRHTIGQPSSADVVVFEETDERFYVGIRRSRSEKILLISSGSAVTSESRYILADQPNDEFKVILPRKQDVEYSVSHRGSHFYLTYREPSKPNSELRVAPMADPTKQEVLLAHSREVKLDGVSLSEHFMAVFTRTGGLQRAYVYKLPGDGGAPQGPLDPSTATEVPFDEPAYEMGGGGSGDFDSPVLRIHYSSLTTPVSIIDYNMATGAQKVKKVTPVLGGFDKGNYKTLRLWATAEDGVKVPMSVVYRKDLVKLDGTDPLLLNGYGSYEISNDPYFNSNRLSLLDRGFIFAIAHIRGGGEMGRYWYEDGKFLKKINTFTDFIACAEHLVADRYTTPAKLCIEGRSAGGLLMGAVINLRPDLFNACILGVPFVDCLTTMLDETIPLTVIEWEEWGNPAEKEYYEYMKSYSPMDNVRSVEYPNILATGGLHDPRVGYWEPAKLVAKLRAARPPESKRLLVLKMEMGAGHFSVTGRFERLKEVAFDYAFLLKTQGMLDVKPAGATATA